MKTIPQILDFTFRVIVLLLAVTVGAAFIFIGGQKASAANLKSSATITEAVFTVGDIFSGLSQETAEKVLGPAPQPGHDVVLNARTLMRVAIALDLPWRPASSADQIVIRRAVTLVPADTIKNALRSGLQEKGMDGAFEFVFFNLESPEIILPHGENAAADVTALDYDPQTGRFEASLAAPSQKNPLATLNLAGKIERLVPVPVLKKTTSGGDIINAGDIEWITIKSSSLQNDAVLDGEKIAGMTPRRMIFAGKPVRENELERPELVSRGDTITITYSNGPMALTAKGKAMQSGARGDIIRVVNVSSNRTIEALVEDRYLVTVSE